jgi:arylsulfatase A-like enzyme
VSPNLENFIKNGTTFLNAITNGSDTPSSFSAIFTSILPFLNGGYSPLPMQKITFPQILEENGIFNIGIHSNPNLERFFNYGRGFNIFLDGRSYDKKASGEQKTFQYLSSKIKNILNKSLLRKLIYILPGFNKVKNWLRRKIPIITKFLLPFTAISYNAPYLVNKIIDILKEHKGRLFLWSHFMDVHRPYNPPSKNILKFRKQDFTRYERDFLANKIHLPSYKDKITSKWIDDLKVLYNSEINFVDQYLASLFNFIIKHYKENCLVIITSDHGESFYEHKIFGHQGSVFEESIRVPLYLIEIGRKPALERIKETVQLIDLAPTILDFYNIQIPDDFQGKSLLPLLRGESLERKKPMITECFQKGGFMKRNNKEGFKLISIRTDKWKYIYDEENNKELLFNIAEDKHEKVDLKNKYQNKLEEFRFIKNHHLSRIIFFTEKNKMVRAINKLNFAKSD